MQGAQGKQSEPKKQRNPRRRKTIGEWQLKQRQFKQNRSQEISHISTGEQVNIFNTEEPSMSYLQLPTRKTQTDNRSCTKCGETGHWKHYCWASTWCKFCMSETHATQVCRSYANFVRDNPIASSRRTTPVQEQRKLVEQQDQHLFPHLPTQHFQPPVIPLVDTRNVQHQQQQQSLQRSVQDVHMDPRFQHPPLQYSQIQQHRQPQPPPAEVNEMGPTNQQGVIQCPVQQGP